MKLNVYAGIPLDRCVIVRSVTQLAANVIGVVVNVLRDVHIRRIDCEIDGLYSSLQRISSDVTSPTWTA